MLYRSLLRPLLFRLPPETAHELALHSLAIAPGLAKHLADTPRDKSPFGTLQCFGLNFPNPVGLAAGFDKDGIALPGLAALGFGFIEAGTVTHQPQPGNERPRLFRLPEDKALINRAGFNNLGAAAFASRVSKVKLDCVIGVSIGKSKVAPLEAVVADYLKSFETVYPVADYVAINVSSPNTPGLRELQQADHLASLLAALQKRNLELSAELKRAASMPLLVKLSPDLKRDELEPIVKVVRRAAVAGIIATNTTTERVGLRSAPSRVAACGAGGLSGAPLQKKSNEMIARLHQLTNGSLPLIGVGGIFTAHDAWQKICAGASLVQLYTGFIYQGPSIANEINAGLAMLLKQSGLKTLAEAVGSRTEEFLR
ncbi:MAG: quinone-dependent dihydroorotate dehydrogenase [bacterium]